MSEYDNYVYEWTYDEDNQTYLCVGQLFCMLVFFDDELEAWVATLVDETPVDARWSGEQEEVTMQAIHRELHEAMDWCEVKDTQESEFDSTTFTK